MIDTPHDRDTIVALATPEGHAALGVVRLSGSGSWSIAAQALRNPKLLDRARPRFARLVDLIDRDGTLLDQAILLPFRGPASYTGEDMVELSCHGGRESLLLVVKVLRELGARPAQPGEFTRRAFINGKLTLDQAEAVAALIDARTSAAAKAAARVLAGGLGDRIRHQQERLADLLALVEIGLDFVEEELRTFEPAQMQAALLDVLEGLQQLHRQYRAGRRLRQGTLVVIAGPPNVGKSTLLNRILGYDRAIVSEQPGTTRDYLDVPIDLHGLPVILVDTAGLRVTGDMIEAEGTQRAWELFERADRILWLLAPPNWETPPDDISNDPRLTVLVNKSDLGGLPSQFARFPLISAMRGDGVEAMIRTLVADLLEGAQPDELLLLEERQALCLTDAIQSLRTATDLLREELRDELLASELRNALNSLGEITGAITTDDLLERIFSRFCIGK